MSLASVLSMLIPVTFIGFQIAELVRPARRLPTVKRWRLKGFLYFGLAGLLSTNVPGLVPFAEHRLLDTSSLGLWMVLPAYFVVQLLMYGLHRLRHMEPLWRFHQLHHASERFDAASGALFHPLDMVPVFLVSSAVTVWLLGLSPDAAALVGYVGFFAGTFQHANMRTPRWIGWIMQRPEAHSIHHARSVHAFNYVSLPLVDMMFGTYRNPEDFEPHVGFFDGASAQNARLWLGLDATRREPVGVRGFVVGAVMLALVAASGALVTRSRAIAEANRPSIGERPELLDEALALPQARAYEAHWLPQANPLMGPTSLANALRSWGDVDVNEGILLEGSGKCEPFGKCFNGLTLDEVADIATAKSARVAGVTSVRVVRGVDLATFRAEVARANDADRRVMVNFHVGTLDGSERSGHHSPIAGYLAEHDLVLIKDTSAARGPFLVSTERLWNACAKVDGASNKQRGLVVLER